MQMKTFELPFQSFLQDSFETETLCTSHLIYFRPAGVTDLLGFSLTGDERPQHRSFFYAVNLIPNSCDNHALHYTRVLLRQ